MNSLEVLKTLKSFTFMHLILSVNVYVDFSEFSFYPSRATDSVRKLTQISKKLESLFMSTTLCNWTCNCMYESSKIKEWLRTNPFCFQVPWKSRHDVLVPRFQMLQFAEARPPPSRSDSDVRASMYKRLLLDGDSGHQMWSLENS